MKDANGDLKMDTKEKVGVPQDQACTLMIVDFYRGVIQDRSSTTVYLKD